MLHPARDLHRLGVLEPDLDAGRYAVGIAAWEWAQYLGAEAREQGVRANVSSFTRHHPNVMMTKAKISGNYANSMLAKTESVRLGFDEAIMLDPYGFVAECTGENLFLVRDGKIVTPDSATVLEGITRDALLDDRPRPRLRGRGRPGEPRPALRGRRGVRVRHGGRGRGLREIDFRTIGSGRTGPVTRRLQEAYHAAVRGRAPRYAEWTTVVTPDCLPEGWPQGAEALSDAKA